MVGWHHRLDGHEFEQAPGADDGQGSLVCCSPRGRNESDTTERLKRTELKVVYFTLCGIFSTIKNYVAEKKINKCQR